MWPLSANGNRLRLLKKVVDQIRKTTVACLDHHFLITKFPYVSLSILIWYQWSGAQVQQGHHGREEWKDPSSVNGFCLHCPTLFKKTFAYFTMSQSKPPDPRSQLSLFTCQLTSNLPAEEHPEDVAKGPLMRCDRTNTVFFWRVPVRKGNPIKKQYMSRLSVQDQIFDW